ncbi:hypothetical protein, partial [Sporolactobacillus spathodeae]|uniref:hypothetical protein n=1 Tax=Sporolactobacillus spathodeae TaxID=1465502 RepID=UPI0039E9EBFB
MDSIELKNFGLAMPSFISFHDFLCFFTGIRKTWLSQVFLTIALRLLTCRERIDIYSADFNPTLSMLTPTLSMLAPTLSMPTPTLSMLAPTL